MKLKTYINEFSLGITSILLYFFTSIIKYILLDIFNVSQITGTAALVYSFANEILLVALILLVFHKKIEKDIEDMKKNHKKYFSENFKYYLIGIAIMLISNSILIYGFNNGIAGNEEGIRDLFGTHPIYTYISAVLFAPVVEELVFRQGIRYIIPNKLLFILISGFVFGGLHIIGNVNSFVDFLYIIPYSSLGLVFAYILTKTNNIFVTIGLHLMHNGILMAIQAMVALFG